MTIVHNALRTNIGELPELYKSSTHLITMRRFRIDDYCYQYGIDSGLFISYDESDGTLSEVLFHLPVLMQYLQEVCKARLELNTRTVTRGQDGVAIPVAQYIREELTDDEVLQMLDKHYA